MQHFNDQLKLWNWLISSGYWHQEKSAQICSCVVWFMCTCTHISQETKQQKRKGKLFDATHQAQLSHRTISSAFLMLMFAQFEHVDCRARLMCYYVFNFRTINSHWEKKENNKTLMFRGIFCCAIHDMNMNELPLRLLSIYKANKYNV